MQQPISICAYSVDSRSASNRDLLEPILSGLLVLAIAAAWPVYVFGDSQPAYVCAVAASMLLAVWLAVVRSQAIVIFLITEVALLGTEANGALARGTPPLGTFRIIDITVLTALLALALTKIRLQRVRAGTAINLRQQSVSDGASRAFAGMLSLSGLLLVFCVVGWALILWLLHGHPLDGITKTDFRVVGLGFAMWLIVRTCESGRLKDLPSAFASLAPATAAKAIAIFASGLWVVGTHDRLQASMSEVYGQQTRVILIGGDTILILVPAATVIALSYVSKPVSRFALWFCALAGFVGLLISGTRSGLLVAAATVGCALLLRQPKLRLRKTPLRAASTVVAIIVLATAGLVVSGTGTRFAQRDAPHVGVNFRVDEVKSFLRLPASDLLLGQGFGGRFEGKDVNGLPVVAGWSHVLPVWICLKIGLGGLVVIIFLLIRLLRKGFAALRTEHNLPNSDHALALVLVVGLLLMSLMINRVALPEGAILFGVALGLLDRKKRSLPS